MFNENVCSHNDSNETQNMSYKKKKKKDFIILGHFNMLNGGRNDDINDYLLNK